MSILGCGYAQIKIKSEKAALISNFGNTLDVFSRQLFYPLVDPTMHVTDMLLHQTPPFIPSMFSAAMVKP